MTTILVADDSETILLLMRTRLEMAGYTVQTAADGQEVLDHIAAGVVPDMLLLDAMMPRKSDLIFVSEGMDLNGARVDNRLSYGPIFMAGYGGSIIRSRNWGSGEDIPVSDRHSGGCNLLMFDNSVRYMKFDEVFPFITEPNDGTNPKNFMRHS